MATIKLSSVVFLVVLLLQAATISNVCAQNNNATELRLPANEKLSTVAQHWIDNFNPDQLPERIRSTQGLEFGKAAAADCPGQLPANENWSTRFATDLGGYGTNDDVFAMAADGDDLYVGGSFTHITGFEANGIAVRQNNEWFPLDNGSAIGVDGFVYAIAVDGDNVYVGGQFESAGGIPAQNIARWNTTTNTWSALGNGISGGQLPFVSSIAIDKNNIYIGGEFTTASGTPAANIACWNGSAWNALGAGIEGAVSALAVAENKLYVGGDFKSAGGMAIQAIACWNGTAWEAISGGGVIDDDALVGYVNTLAVNHRGELFAGGSFTGTGLRYIPISLNPMPTPLHNVARWNGEDWDALTGVIDQEVGNGTTGDVRAIAIYNQIVYVAGNITSVTPRDLTNAEIPVNFIARWIDNKSNLAWRGLAEGTDATINALAVSPTGLLYAGGAFTSADGLPATHIASWNSRYRIWKPLLNPRARGVIQSMALINNEVYAGGDFISSTLPGAFLEDNHIAVLRPKGWHLASGTIQGTIVTIAPNPEGDELFVGGYFITAGKQISVNVAKLDTKTGLLAPLTVGSGVATGEGVSFVSSIAVYGDNVYMGGRFTIADEIRANNIVCWNRTTSEWSALGTGLNSTVWAIAVDKEGTLYAGGDFTSSGSNKINRVARWNGTEWLPLEDGANKTVYSMAASQDFLYIGGAFDSVAGRPMNHIARMDRSANTWLPLGEGIESEFEPSIDVLVTRGRELFAGGNFTLAGGDTVNNIAWWDGYNWSSLGSGVNSTVRGMVVRNDQELYVGGYFTEAGCKSSEYLGLWHAQPSSVRPEPSPLPIAGTLGQNFPNPFGQTTTIQFVVAGNGSVPVHLTVFNAKGEAVHTLVDENMVSGTYSVDVDAGNLPPGPYYYRLRNGAATETRTMIVVR